MLRKCANSTEVLACNNALISKTTVNSFRIITIFITMIMIMIILIAI